MTEASSPHDRVSAVIERLLAPVVSVGLGVLTWLTLLLAAGAVLRLESLSIRNLIPLFFVGLLFWPIYHLQPWREGVSTRTRRWARQRRSVLLAVVGLGVLPMVPLVPDLLVSLLQLPYRGSGVFFGASLFYRNRFGPLAGRLLLRFGQWYFELLWLYLLGTGVVGVIRRIR